jgi:hypothetical protein
MPAAVATPLLPMYAVRLARASLESVGFVVVAPLIRLSAVQLIAGQVGDPWGCSGGGLHGPR